METPRWLKTGCNCCQVGVSGRTSFMEKTLLGISSLLEEHVFSDKYPQRAGLLQSLDPRFKLLSLLLLIVAVSLLNHLSLIIGVYLLTLVLAYLSRIELGFFLKRVWLFIPLFAGVIAVPALFNFITPGEPLLQVSSGILGSGEITVTKPGVDHAVIFVSRVAASVSLAVLLTLTTRWSDLLKSLEILRIPRIFVLVLAMSYRYIFLLLRLVQDMHLAKKSRTIRLQATRREQNWVASRIGYLLLRSLKMSQEVHLAMLSRGFTGELKSHTTFKPQRRDRAWTAFTLALTGSLLILNHLVL